MSKVGDRFYLDMRGIHAEGMITENGFMAFKGSEVRNHQAPYLAKSIVALRQKYLNDGTNLPDPDVLAGDIIENLQSALTSFSELMATLNK